MIKNIPGLKFLISSITPGPDIRCFVTFCTLVLPGYSLASASSTEPALVLSEVLYHSSLSSLPVGRERGEFIEIYNPGCSVVELTEYSIRDNNGDETHYQLSTSVPPTGLCHAENDDL